MNIRKVLENRIVVLDGAMGTMIQSLQLPDDAYQWGIDVQAGCGCAHCSAHGHGSQKGNNDALNLLAPEAIASVHQAYVDAGADLITTNTFSGYSKKRLLGYITLTQIIVTTVFIALIALIIYLLYLSLE